MILYIFVSVLMILTFCVNCVIRVTYLNRYIAIGAAQRILITEGTYGDLMRRFDNSVGIEHEVHFSQYLLM